MYIEGVLSVQKMGYLPIGFVKDWLQEKIGNTITDWTELWLHEVASKNKSVAKMQLINVADSHLHSVDGHLAEMEL